MFYNRYSQNAYSVPGPVLVSGDGMVSRAALLWLLRLGPGSKADQCAGGCLDAYMSLGAIYVHHLPGPSSLGCMWQDVVFGAAGCLHLALSSPSSVVPSPCSLPPASEFLTDPLRVWKRNVPENVLGLGLVNEACRRSMGHPLGHRSLVADGASPSRVIRHPSGAGIPGGQSK